MFTDMLIKQYNYKDTIHNPKDVLRFCRDLKGLCKEVFLVIFLDSNNGVIAKEKPDALLPTLGGQTALNIAMQLYENGVLKKYNVKMLGADYEVIKKAEDRDSIVMRFYNPTGETQDGSITFGLPISKAWKNNINEVRGEELAVENGAVKLSVPKGKIVTIEVE